MSRCCSCGDLTKFHIWISSFHLDLHSDKVPCAIEPGAEAPYYILSDVVKALYLSGEWFDLPEDPCDPDYMKDIAS